MKKIVVLGSGSFAGSQYIHHTLAPDTKIIGINRSAQTSALFLPYLSSPHVENFTFLQLDINKDLPQIFQCLDDFEPDIIVDFAGQGMVAESWQQPHQWYQTNVVSKVKLHQFLIDKAWLKRYIRISTPEVYGSSESMIDESAVFNPSTPYAVSHAAIDMSLKTFHKQYGFPVVFTRYSNFYGAGQQLYRIIPRTILYALSDQVLSLHGGGHAIRAFIHGKDVAQAINKAIDYGVTGETYHFSTTDFVSIRELVQRIHQQMGVDHDSLVTISDDRPGKDLKYLMDDTKSRRDLGWTPTVSLDEGIAQTVAWVTKNRDALLKYPLNYEHKE